MPLFLITKKSKYMSKTIFFIIIALIDYPCCLISSRDKYELKDRMIHIGALISMFFGGDFLLNNILGRMSDKFFNTKVMETGKGSFLKNFTLSQKNMEKIISLKDARSKKASAAIYWASLLINMLILGIGLPAILNKILKNDIAGDKAALFNKLAKYRDNFK